MNKIVETIEKYASKLMTSYCYKHLWVDVNCIDAKSDTELKMQIIIRNRKDNKTRGILVSVENDLIKLTDPKAPFRQDRVKYYKSVHGLKLGVNSIARSICYD